MTDEQLHHMLLDLYRKNGQVKRTIKHQQERIDRMADEIQEVKDALTNLQTDVSTRLGELQAEIAKLESEHGVPAGALQGLKDLVASIDSAVKGATPPAPTA